MQTKLKFALDEHNNPIIKFQLADNPDEDLRDDVARRFFEALGHSSSWLRIQFNATYPLGGTISPVPPSDLEKTSKEMAGLVMTTTAKTFSS